MIEIYGDDSCQSCFERIIATRVYPEASLEDYLSAQREINGIKSNCFRSGHLTDLG
jgi:hypothetical protein